MSVYEKLNIVQCKLNAPKKRFNKFGNYNYRNCEDILEGCKPLFEENKCSVVLSDEIIQIADRFYVKAIATFIDTETGEKVENYALAREPLVVKGMSDPQITGASSTYARKYALNGLLCIDDTVDDDSEELKNEKDNRSKAQAKKNAARPAEVIEDKNDEVKNQEMIDNTDKDLVPHGEGMTERRLARLKKAQEICKKNDKTILATAKANSFEEITEANYIAVMNLFLRLMTPEQRKEIEAI